MVNVKDEPTISVFVPTIGRPTLARTLASLRLQEWRPGDEVVLMGDGVQSEARELWDQFGLPGRYIEEETPLRVWGHGLRNKYTRLARTTHVAALDDDDQYTPTAVRDIRAAITLAPDRPHIFRMEGHPSARLIWRTPVLESGNVGTPLFVTPVGKLGEYGPVYNGDFMFIRDTCAMYPDGPVWREEVVCLVRPHEARIVNESQHAAQARQYPNIFVPETVLNSRLAACITCPNYLPNTKRCNLCGCPVGSKAKRKDATCPDKPNRWSLL